MSFIPSISSYFSLLSPYSEYCHLFPYPIPALMKNYIQHSILLLKLFPNSFATLFCVLYHINKLIKNLLLLLLLIFFVLEKLFRVHITEYWFVRRSWLITNQIFCGFLLKIWIILSFKICPFVGNLLVLLLSFLNLLVGQSKIFRIGFKIIEYRLHFFYYFILYY